jgi:hypothetical protein
MSILLRCQSCHKPLKVKEELAGKKVKCPSCGQSVPVPLPEVEAEAEPEPVVAEMEEAVTAAKPRGKPDRAAPKDESKPTGPSKWVPCPKCGTPDPKRVKFTFWGSFYGPKLFNHVRCQQCQATYNGRTGGSNILPAIGCVMVPLMGILLIIAALGSYAYYQMVYLPEKQQEELKKGRRSQVLVRELDAYPIHWLVRPKS